MLQRNGHKMLRYTSINNMGGVVWEDRISEEEMTARCGGVVDVGIRVR